MLAKSPWDFSSLRNPALSAPSYTTDCPSPHLSSQTFPGLVPTWPYLLLRSPEQDSVLQVCSHHLPQPAGDCLTKAAQDILGFHCLQEHLAGLCRVHPPLPLSLLPMLLGYVGTAGSHLIQQSSQPTTDYQALNCHVAAHLQAKKRPLSWCQKSPVCSFHHHSSLHF